MTSCSGVGCAFVDAASPAVRRLVDHVVGAVDAAQWCDAPFQHLVLDKIFPDDLYGEMTAAMPAERNFQPLAGRHRSSNRRADGSATRIKVDLLPELVRRFRPEHRTLWTVVGGALRARSVRDAFVRRLGPGLRRRFGAGYAATNFFAVPMLTRDTAGYQIHPHTDTRWKAITVHIYLPRDGSLDGVGTVFSERLPDGTLRRVKQVAFIPNHGYAFAVGDDTWHSVDPLDDLPLPRDSILHTYFVDQGLLLKTRNRARRLGNFVANEARWLIQGTSLAARL
jgi:hypothetical protein